MVTIKKHDDLNLRIYADSVKYLDVMKGEFTRIVPNFRFTPAYKSGKWNGRISMINKWNHTFPYGLLTDYIRVHKKYFPREPLKVEDEVKEIFSGPKMKIKYDLSLKPRPYQKDCIEACLEYTKCIIRSATASGKSFVIATIIRNLLHNNLIKKCILIVPRTDLIIQFMQDLTEYGFDHNSIGTIHAEAKNKKKQWEKQIVISTWQSLARNHDKLDMFQCIICDETHSAKSHEMKKILEKAKKAQFRYGFTGTLHNNDLDNWNTKSYLGPVVREYSAGQLAEEGWISKCNVNVINVEYNNEYAGEYNDVRDTIFRNDYRMKIIGTLAQKLDHNVLLLVNKVEKEGDVLKSYLENHVKGKEIVFLSGRDSLDVRSHWKKQCADRDDIILIATYGIFQLGINIPNLKYVILTAPFKAKIRNLQSIGRALRPHKNKEESGAQIFDIHDHTIYFEKYGDIRIRYYVKEEFGIFESVFHEGDEISLEEIMPSAEI